MTAEQALDLLNKVTAVYQGTRQDHLNIQAALNVLKDEIAAKKKVEKK